MNESDKLEIAQTKHKEKFGVEPITIGLYWDRIDLLAKKINESIKKGIPYDELESLSKEDRKLFDQGELIF